MKVLNILAITFAFLIVLTLPSAYALTNVTSCQTLSSAGEKYVLNQSLISADGETCLAIQADNITLDCAGFSVTNSTNGNAMYTQNSNTSVMDCVLGDSFAGFRFSGGATLSTIEDSILHNNSFGVFVETALNSIDNVTAYGNSQGIGIDANNNTVTSALLYSNNDGIDVSNDYNNISNVVSRSNNDDGVYVTGNSNIFDNVISYSNSDDGFRVEGNNNQITNSKSYSNAVGFNIISGIFHEISDSISYSCSSAGISSETSGSNIVFDNVTSYDNPIGLVMEATTGVTISNSLFNNNAQKGIDISADAKNIVITDTNTSYNSDSGVRVTAFDGLGINNLVSIGNGDEGIYVHDGDDLNISYSLIDSSADEGLLINNITTAIIISLNSSYNDDYGILSSLGCDTCNITDSTILGNANYGIFWGSSDNTYMENLRIDDSGFSLFFDKSPRTDLSNTKITNSGSTTTYVKNSKDVMITNISMSGSSDKGLYLRNSTNVMVFDSILNGNTSGLEVDNSDNNENSINVYNSSISRLSSNPAKGSVYLTGAGTGNSTAIITNTTFTDWEVGNNSQFLVNWWLNITNNTQSSTVTTRDALGSTIATSSNTSQFLLTRQFTVTSFNSQTNTTPHTVNATLGGYNPFGEYINMNQNQLVVISMAVAPPVPPVTGLVTSTRLALGLLQIVFTFSLVLLGLALFRKLTFNSLVAMIIIWVIGIIAIGIIEQVSLAL